MHYRCSASALPGSSRIRSGDADLGAKIRTTRAPEFAPFLGDPPCPPILSGIIEVEYSAEDQMALEPTHGEFGEVGKSKVAETLPREGEIACAKKVKLCCRCSLLPEVGRPPKHLPGSLFGQAPSCCLGASMAASCFCQARRTDCKMPLRTTASANVGATSMVIYGESTGLGPPRDWCSRC